MPPAPRAILLRRFATDIETLMAAWTAPQQVARWWARIGATVMFVEITARAGGSFILLTIDADGKEHETRGRFREIVPCDAIVIDWAGDPAWSLVLQFWPIASGTELTLTESPFADAAERDTRIEHWSDAMERLRRVVETR